MGAGRRPSAASWCVRCFVTPRWCPTSASLHIWSTSRSPSPPQPRRSLRQRTMPDLAGGRNEARYSCRGCQEPSLSERRVRPPDLPRFGSCRRARGRCVRGYAALVLSRAPGHLRCPRCGTANNRLAQSCDACDLAFYGGIRRGTLAASSRKRGDADAL
jgi:hypothetical protein